jgi:nucleoside-diphosphate-sugar epimerase
MYNDDCVTGIDKLMASSYSDPLNQGRSELVSINETLSIIERIAGVEMKRKYKLDAPQGVRGRNSDNTLIKEVLGWEPGIDLKTGLETTYWWIKEQYEKRQRGERVVQ